jgi:nucleoside 2-deoxyribosyltransferase
MARCFVIQPFDQGGPYDKRYRDVLSPAIVASNLEPYRVDEDPKATILIDDIENGIREAEICLADITENNPNIWYEVGFALANGRPVVLICADPRPSRFPFDIQHRHIIKYTLHSPRDFEALMTEITTRLKAQAKKAEVLQTVAAMSEMQNTEGLSSHEIAVAVTIMSERDSSESGLSTFMIKDKMRRSGYTSLAVGLALESLARKAMIEEFMTGNNFEDTYAAYRLTPKGTDWMLVNQGRFRMRKGEPSEVESSAPITDEDIPF